MKISKLGIVFALFFTSGFCGLLYQIVWLRKAFAAFGVITPVVSLVVSLFMLGLALGSWLGGKYIELFASRMKCSPIILYGLTELLIGVGGISATKLFSLGAGYLLGFGESDSGHYLLASAAVITVSILPWCVCMGATIPFAMAYVGRLGNRQSSFSYLYLANMLGAVAGVSITGVFLIELFGFSCALILAASLNAAIALASFALGIAESKVSSGVADPERKLSGNFPPAALKKSGAFVPFVLFITGFCCMGMEVVWTRAFTPITTTTIYAYILLLATYLIASGEGLLIYRRHLTAKRVLSFPRLLAFLAITSFLPLLLTDPRFQPTSFNIILGLLPFCAGLGYLTPLLIDQHSGGSPKAAGRYYAINAFGCILGPLFAGYILLPYVGCKWSLVLLAIPFTALFLLQAGSPSLSRRFRFVWISLAIVVMALASFSNTYEDFEAGPGSVLFRDNTATVIAKGSGKLKSLLVNSICTTYLTPTTKVMAHMPLAFLQHRPSSALIICLGMGTTYRSALSWNIRVTAVELVPSVKRALGYFVPNSAELLNDKMGRIIIDDGRRYLQRTSEKYDVITLDPPPPVEASASSLLYSEEFYRLAKAHLQENGILQQWYPGGEDRITFAIIGAITNSFPYVRIYRPLRDSGIHLLASMTPIATPTCSQVISKMPASARNDFMEWYPNLTAEQAVEQMLSKQVNLEELLDSVGQLTITDDKPINEYFAMRRNMMLLKAAAAQIRRFPFIGGAR